MKFIADLHIHSRHSIATSKQLIPEMLDLWARKKGIQVLGTGDSIHPGWRAELKEKLTPVEDGLFKLNKSLQLDEAGMFGDPVHFILTAEISCIYKKGGRVRKVHNIILAPGFKAIEQISKKLSAIGNITSDGRPILGLDSRNLLEIVLEADPAACLIPAHIWTPWFSVLGSKSGFDSVDECYGDLSDHIFAVETGLSSDPLMNWQCSFLDKYSLVSNSDAHSPEKLGREANSFNTDMSYFAIMDALKGKSKGFLGTVEYFPEEGKYHLDGHRKCDIRWEPHQTKKHKGICPVCGKPVTVGVLNRVSELADSDSARAFKSKRPFVSLTPLKNVLAEKLKVNCTSKKVSAAYDLLICKIGPEFSILMDLPLEEIRKVDSLLADGIEKLRLGDVSVMAGYDGVFGDIKVFQ